MSDDDSGESGTADAVAAGIEQFQRAALDALRAARAMLDAAETIVTDPKAIESVLSGVVGTARDVTQTVAGFAAAAGRHATGADPDPDDGDGYETIDID